MSPGSPRVCGDVPFRCLHIAGEVEPKEPLITGLPPGASADEITAEIRKAVGESYDSGLELINSSSVEWFA